VNGDERHESAAEDVRDLFPELNRDIDDRERGGSLTAAGGWCAPSETVYNMGVPPLDLRALFEEARCPSASTDGKACVLPDRLDRHGAGHESARVGVSRDVWPTTDRERLRWTHDCPRPGAALAWAVLRAAGREDPEDAEVPCGECGAVWTLWGPRACGECGRVDPEDGPEWSRRPRLERADAPCGGDPEGT